MAESELLVYPRGQMGFGAGDLMQITDISFDYTNNGQLKHTLKRSPSGKTFGNKELSGSFTVIVDEDGLERDYFARVENGEEVDMRMKIPQLTKGIVGALSGISGSLPLDDAIEFTVNWFGKFVKG